MAAKPSNGLDLTSLDGTFFSFQYCDHGIAESTRKTYQSSPHKFYHFLKCMIFSPFLSVSESTLCYLCTISWLTIKTYQASLRHMQITLELPEPKEYTYFHGFGVEWD